jgi:hypothetical protein
MKKFFKGLAVLVVIVLSIPFVLYTMASAASFAFFYRSLERTNTNACTHYYTGASKGTIWSYGEWHHYVDFEIDGTSLPKRWKVVDAPLPSSVWKDSISSPDTLRVTYRWPSNWQDPFPVDDWKVCAIGS